MQGHAMSIEGVLNSLEDTVQAWRLSVLHTRDAGKPC